ncbi:GNAT family N-acetyltransferase [Fulvimarina sp. 2208YS6-2-32]|uniref:GNAT family N-acetyltransferase n=1 Tax=Fulvimarina uroteuthidis TaxID=3098149 RepID=A0ABU5I2Z5_9HYPH|nr:GNAT family N-acetyltransferase [Fulvimarina sp. 2208YS6-2-32]MDY8109723.1 GNAT family N-acetyltransferase [Fulvimarina sp. 2208YS6-2-32]
MSLSLRVADDIHTVPSAIWDGLAENDAARAEAPDAASGPSNPFLSHAFLSALEDSGCVGGRTGWHPQHLLLEDETGTVRGIAPAYAKTHSQGEYVFDYGWADAFQRAGGRYYPKLQLSVPFTPAGGPRLLVGHGDLANLFRAGLIQGIEAYCDQTNASSAHATFLRDADLAVMESADWLHRTDQQFHFINRGYATYEDFLATLASRKRKDLRKERAKAVENDIEIVHLTGGDLDEAAWDAFYRFYMDTGERKWGRPYLNRRFFSLISERMSERILLVMARREGRYIAGALNFIGADRLYGRNWGCIEEHPFLHFEVCYHQAIDFAIRHRLGVVEAGAQGQHKIARGYEPVTTHSAHYIRHKGLRAAIADYLEGERDEVERMNELLEEHTPFKKG